MTEIKKICFVIMGFGKKKDPNSNRTIDLDETFKKIIRPAVNSAGFVCVRADEISESGIIDRSMYALLMKAELVIADISTYNPNAIYELGVRHAVKPYSTIIIKEEDSNIAFDISHNKILSYKHLGNEISNAEAIKSVRELKALIITVTENPLIDSPLYTFIPKVAQPMLSEEDYNEIIGELKEKEDSIYALMEKAKELMKQNNFILASEKWEKLNRMVENEIYFVQQQALCVYKSKMPVSLVALTNALTIIKRVENSNDSETLGITGAIYKNLWKETSEVQFLDQAIEFYKKGFHLFNDYYTAENYSHCLERKAEIVHDQEEKTYYKYEAKLTRKKIIELLLPQFNEPELEEIKWKSATLSNCFLSLDDHKNANKFENLFLQQNPLDWEIESFNTSKKEIKGKRSVK